MAVVRTRGAGSSSRFEVVGSVRTRPRGTTVVVALLTAVALALRIRGMREGLWGDELYSIREIRGRSLSGALDTVANGLGHGSPLENTPPLYFVMAWSSAKLGNDTVWIRLPSVLFSTLTVPLVYVLGARTITRRAGVVAAGLMALSPFSIFYGTEARAYAMLTSLGVLTALLLILAVRSERRWPWVAYGAAAAALLYTQYTGAVLLAAEAAWALWFHRGRARALTLALAAAALALAPWAPYVHGNPADFGALAALSGFSHYDSIRQWLVGLPNQPPKTVPGHLALLLLGAAFAIALAGAVTRAPARDRVVRRSASIAPEKLLLLGLALVTPVACLAYSAFGQDLFAFPRNLIGSLPFCALLIGWLLTAPAGRPAAIATGLAGLALLLGALRTLQPSNQRPNFPALARALEAEAGPRDVLVYYGAGFDPFVLHNHLSPYLHRPHPTRGAAALVPSSLGRALGAGRGGEGHAFVAGLSGRGGTLAFPSTVGGWRRVARRAFPGTSTLTLATYRPSDGKPRR